MSNASVKKLPITFNFVATNCNPADCLTRCLSLAMLQRSCYHTGPDFLKDGNYCADLSVEIPTAHYHTVKTGHAAIERVEVKTDIIALEKYSGIRKPIRIISRVLKYVCLLKRLIGKPANEENFIEQAWKVILRQEQRKQFGDTYEFLL